MNIRFLTILIFAYTCIEGLVVNILYPNTLPFIFKDFAIAIAYLVLLTDNRGSSGSLARLTGPLALFAVVTGFFLVLPSPVSLLGELVALKQRLFYIPLAYVGYRYVTTEEDLEKLLGWMALTAIPVSIFGIYLYFVGPAGLTALGANYSAVIMSTMGEHGESFWRVPSTFNSPGQFGMFLLAHGCLFIGFLMSRRLPARLRMLTILSLVSVIGALLVSGSRSPLLLLVMCTVFMLVFDGRLTGIGVWAAGLYGVLTVAFSYFGGGVEDRVGSIASWEHVQRFNQTYFGQLFLPMLMQSPMGFGRGRATIGARHFTDWSTIMLVESYFGVIVAETGLLGLAAFGWAMVNVVTAVLACRRVMMRAPTKMIWLALALLVLTIVGLMPVSTTIEGAPGNLYFWFFLGVTFRLYDLEVARRQQGGQPVAAAPAVMPAPSYQ